MSFLNLQASYFTIEDPRRVLERWFNRFRYCSAVRINQREIEVKWTARAEREMRQLDLGLVVELQLYFSCVIKKRTLFHTRGGIDATRVNDRLGLTFRSIASAVCDPREFASSYPQGKNLSGGKASRMVPRTVEIDFRQGDWEGQFYY